MLLSARPRFFSTASRTAGGLSWDRIPSAVKVVDVSPRDGLQNEKRAVDTATKVQFISRLCDAGLKYIEATSFVSPKAVPQMADAADVMQQALALNRDCQYAALVPNLRGLEAAAKAGFKEVTVLAAATETMAQRNTRCSLEEANARALEVMAAAKQQKIRIRLAVSVAMGCPFEGDVPERNLVSIVEKLYADCDDLFLCDTIGVATPMKVRRVLESVLACGVDVDRVGLHLHDTYGQATANLLAGLQAGVSLVDVSAGGLGGCPFAGPGASGNQATEDVIYMLDGMGVETGINVQSLAETGAWMCDYLGRPHGSRAGAALLRTSKAVSGDKKESPAVPSTSSSASKPVDPSTGPLTGYRVVELGNFIAGPFCATTLGYFGADVIKVETPGKGDPIRYWRSLAEDGLSPWCRSLMRNKRSITVDLKNPDGLEVVRKLIASSDVVVENFRPGVLEKLGLGPDSFKESNPGLIFARISGYGQSGPYKMRGGFASAAEAEGGFRYLTGFPGQNSVRPNLSLGDSLAGVQAALGVAMALLSRSKTGRGQIVDMALYEAVYNMMEGLIPDYTTLGYIRQPSGTTVSGIVPTNSHVCKDGRYVVIGANADQLFKKLMTLMGRKDMAEDERYATNVGRVEHQEEIYGAIDAWCASMPAVEVLAKLNDVGCPAGPVNDAADMMADPHFQARGMFEEVETPTGLKLKIPAMVPKLSETPGQTRWCGPQVGAHTKEVLKDYLGYSDDTIAKLRA
eukprot:CAMPEP_0178387006 /NCGR_PEP_ID=MMETSP0689_2-20121128/8854_1 /TAXON_ID=160604 /ORGANISM="Amphidinium massartii, Strain CS-259" /LENGTH=743 /DNA_ID=CAMNT_0020007363 /DNA_START=110 /DNA_END=2338 /DNA_ORIENTATION=-